MDIEISYSVVFHFHLHRECCDSCIPKRSFHSQLRGCSSLLWLQLQINKIIIRNKVGRYRQTDRCISYHVGSIRNFWLMTLYGAMAIAISDDHDRHGHRHIFLCASFLVLFWYFWNLPPLTLKFTVSWPVPSVDATSAVPSCSSRAPLRTWVFLTSTFPSPEE